MRLYRCSGRRKCALGLRNVAILLAKLVIGRIWRRLVGGVAKKLSRRVLHRWGLLCKSSWTWWFGVGRVCGNEICHKSGPMARKAQEIRGVREETDCIETWMAGVTEVCACQLLNYKSDSEVRRTLWKLLGCSLRVWNAKIEPVVGQLKAYCRILSQQTSPEHFL